MKYLVTKSDKKLIGEIQLPTSKSISNRLLIIKALCNLDFIIHNLSESDDTRLMQKALNSKDVVVDVGAAGTAMRFLTAYFAARPGEEKILTGSERMKERPIGILVNSLLKLGANVSFIEKENYPPIRIIGSKLNCLKPLEVDSSISSQFISGLLMVAPTMETGLLLALKNKIISSSYIHLTLNLMQHYGINYIRKNNEIYIRPQKYSARDYYVEADWSAASYWYEMAALAEDVDLKILGLHKSSLQGDAIVSRLFEYFGIKTTFIENGIHLTREKEMIILKKGRGDDFVFNFVGNPDLAQTFAVTLCLLGIPFTFSGVESLKIKETDRIGALENELVKLGFNLQSNISEMSWDGLSQPQNNEFEIETYHDHRMAMAFAPVALQMGSIVIDDPDVVTKSYPDYWKDLQKVGFMVTAL